jgi:hypothetical protein
MVGVRRFAFLAAALAALLSLTGCDQLPLKDDIVALVAQLNGGGGGSGDVTAPVPGNSGTLAADTVTGTSFWMRWAGATDDQTTTLNLQYKIVVSTADNITTVADAESSGGGRVIKMDWQNIASSTMVSGLTTGTQYYVVLLVKDEAGNKAAYAKREGPPSLTVKQGATVYPSGGMFNYGTVGNAVYPATFIILNQGFGMLRLTNTSPGYVTVSTSFPAVFFIATQPAAGAVLPGTTKDFVAQCNTDYSFTTRTGVLHLPCNDPDVVDFALNLQAYCAC